jgi:hypothetical protein
MSLQCRPTDRLAIIASDAKAHTILRHTARNKKLDDGSVFIRWDNGGLPTFLLEGSLFPLSFLVFMLRSRW